MTIAIAVLTLTWTWLGWLAIGALLAIGWDLGHARAWTRRHSWALFTVGAYIATSHAAAGHLARTAIGLAITIAGAHLIRTAPTRRQTTP